MEAKFVLDEKDRKILWLLSIDSRQSFSKIASKVGISKEVANYRIRRMQENGIIKKFYALIDPSALGYITARIFLKFQHSDAKIRDKFINHYIASPLAGWTVGVVGEYDLGIQFWGKTIAELYESKKKFVKNGSKYIKDSSVGIYHKIHFFDRKYLSPKKAGRDENMHATICSSENVHLDSEDIVILNELFHDARTPTIEIAKKTGLSAPTVDYKIKRLKGNAIKAFTVMVDLDRIGRQWYKARLALDDYGAIDRIIAFAAEHPLIISAYEMLAGGEIELEVEVESMQEFQVFLDELTSKFPEAVRHYDYVRFLQEYKPTSIPKITAGIRNTSKKEK